MTYAEVKKKLIKCEKALKALQNQPQYRKEDPQVKQLQALKESLLKKFNLIQEGLTESLNEEGTEFSQSETGKIAIEVGKALTVALKKSGDELARMKAKRIQPNSFDIHVTYKAEEDTDEFSFYISNDMLHLVDFSFDKELVDVGNKPSGEAIINRDVLANELFKHFETLNEDGVNEVNYNHYTEPKHFDICPGAEALRKQLIDGGKSPEDLGEWTYKHDELFKLEKEVLKAKKADEGDVKIANGLRDEILHLSRDLGIEADKVHYLKGHVDKIKEFLNEVVNQKDVKALKKLSKDLKGSSQAHLAQKKRLDKIINTEGTEKHYIKVPRTQYKKAQSVIDDVLRNDVYGGHKLDIVDNDGQGNVIFYFMGPEEKAITYDAVVYLRNSDIDVVDSSVSDVDEAVDHNDPVLMKMRAAKAKAARKADDRMARAIGDNPYNSRKDSLVAKLKAMRAQIMRDMEQEAEPEGGPVADAYGEKLNKIDAAIAKATGKKEPTYGLTKEEDDDYEYKGKHQGSNYKWPMSDYMKRRKEADDYYEDPDYYKEDVDVGHQDDEPSMLKNTAYESATYAAKLYKKLAKYDQHDGEVDFPNWWQSKLILAKDYLSKAFHYLDSEEKQPMLDKLALEGAVKELSSNNVVWNWSGDRNELEQVPPEFKAAVRAGLGDQIDDEDFEDAFDGIKNFFADEAGRGDKTFNSDHWVEMIEMDYLEEGVNEGTELYDKNGMQFKRFAGPNGLAMQITTRKLKGGGFDYIQIDGSRLGEFISALAQSIRVFDDLKRQTPVDEALDSDLPKGKHSIAKLQKVHGMIVDKMKELAKLYKDKGGDHEYNGHPVIDHLKSLTSKKKKVQAALDKAVSDKGKGQELAEVTKYEVDDAIGELGDIIRAIDDKAEEAREIVRQVFPNELSRLDAYGAFNGMHSANRYDVTLGGFVDRLEEEGYEIEDGEVFTNEGMTVVGHTPEERKKNAEELVAKAKELGLEANIEYNNGKISSVGIGKNGLESHPDLGDIQDRQFDDYDKNRPKDNKPSFKPKKLKKLKLGGKTYQIGDFDPNDDGRIESIEKYPNGYYITGGIYSDYGDGDDPKEGYGYAIDLKGNEMDEEDLEGMYEGKYKSDAQRKAIYAAKAEKNELKDTVDNREIENKVIEFAKGGILDIRITYHRNKEKVVEDISVEEAIKLINQYIKQTDLTQANISDESEDILLIDDGNTSIDLYRDGSAKYNEAAPGFKHDCAAKVVHEKYGAGTCIPEKHTLVKEGSKYVVTHYDVLFESGKTVTDIPVSELEIKTQTEHWHKGYKKKKK